MKNSAIAALCLTAAFIIGGCFEITQVYTLNPDGSGKVAFENVSPNMSGMMTPDGGEKPDPAKESPKAVKDFMEASKGVDAWADMSCSVLEDGRLSIKGVAYFSDLAKLSFKGESKNSAKWAKNDKGGVLEFEMADNKSADAPQSAPADLTEEQIAAEIKKAREQWKQAKPIMQGVFANIKMDITFILPGKLGEVSGFTKTDAGGVRFLFSGKKYLEVMDQFMADDKAMAEALKKGTKKGEPDKDYTMQAMFGAKGPFKAAVTGELKPAFEYAAEVEKAKAAMPDMLKKLEAGAAKTPQIKESK
ncbi:MAG: hypothetical protein HZA50_03415 [Planctomycetes bacterium]|nr:hypothetical protein [Planctomycetota bacterium]